MLEGYGLLKAASAEEAVRVASGHVAPIHLLLTDVVMRDVLATKPTSPFDGRLNPGGTCRSSSSEADLTRLT
jgi:hypothetical protein